MSRAGGERARERPALCFAYGSNLSAADRRRWCASHPAEASGLDDFVERVEALAWLPDHALRYGYRSRSRGGGALDVRPHPGALAPGALLRVRGEAGWRALDAKEGAGRADPNYERVEVEVLTEDGGIRRATTFRVAAARREPVFTPPAPGYAERVAEGLRALGLDPDAHARAARGAEPRVLDRVFVYGTLLAGEVNERALGAVARRRPARVRGRLLHCRAEGYPGLVDLGRVEGAVEGEIVHLADPAASLAALDGLEGFEGFGRPGSLFERRLARVEVEVDGEVDGEAAVEGQLAARVEAEAAQRAAARAGPAATLAWIYLLAEVPPDAEALPAGSWRARASRRGAGSP